MNDLEKLKSATRQAALSRRKALFDASTKNQSDCLSEVLTGYKGIPMSGFMPIRTEIDPLPAMARASKHGCVGVPFIDAAAQPLRFAKWTPTSKMEPGTLGASIPVDLDVFEPEIVIIPLLAFDRRGGRLGYGGGFYDRTLALLRAKRDTIAIGFAFAGQEIDDVPVEETDQPLDFIVTELGVIEVGKSEAQDLILSC